MYFKETVSVISEGPQCKDGADTGWEAGPSHPPEISRQNMFPI